MANSEDINKFSGKSTLDSGISSFTNKKTFSGLAKKLATGTCAININNTKVPIASSATGVLTNDFNNAIKTVDSTLNIKKYSVPTRLALDSFTNMGNDIDKSLSKSFLLQTLNIKGTDILCSVFCFLISMLSCQDRGNIYEALLNVNRAAQKANATAKAINNSINAVGAIMASGDAITKSASNIFSGGDPNSNIKNIVAAGTTLATAPATINQNIQLINNLFKLGQKQQLILPNVTVLNIWDMSSIVLHCLQNQAVQAADETLSKVTNPLEEKIRDITPQPCFGTMAVRLQQAIINKIEQFKQWMLTQVAELFSGMSDFNANFMSRIDLSITALELISITAALTNITAHFFDIARNCGVSPCNPNSPINPISNEASGVSNREAANASDPFDNVINGPKYTNNVFAPPTITSDNIEDLASKMAPSLGIKTSAPQVFVTPDEVLAVHNIPTDDMPRKIKDLIDRGALNPNLDSNYTVHINPNSINVVYRYDKKCGEK